MVLWTRFNSGDNYQFQGFSSFILTNKFKALKFDLRNWNAEEFGNVPLRKNELLAELNVLDVDIVSHIPSAEEGEKGDCHC